MNEQYQQSMRAGAGLRGPRLQAAVLAALLSQAFPAHAEPQGAEPADAAAADAPSEEGTITILGKRMGMSRVPDGAKLPVELIALPMSVTVIDRELLDDQNAVELQDALRNASGVVPGGYFEGFDFYRIRGFDASGFTFLDGLLADQTFWVQEELFGMESVEVLKGPMSGLFGQAPAGGLVNLVSKRPRQDDFLELDTSAGSYDYFDLGVDANHRFSDRFAARINAVYRERGSFVDQVPVADRLYLAPSLAWELGSSTRLTVLTQFIEEDTGVAQPLPAEGTVLPNPNGRIPISRAVGEPALDNTADISRWQLGWDFTHDFNDAWSLRQVARTSSTDVDFQAIYPWYLEDDLRTLNRYIRKQVVRADADAADTQVIARLGGDVRHTMVMGVDWYRFRQRQGFAYHTFDDPLFPPIDLFDPVYGAPIPDFEVDELFPSELDRVGAYVQDHIAFTEQFSILVGGRYDWTDDGTAKDEEFTPRAGITYEFRPGAAVFASYAESFLPQAGLTFANGDPLPPETGEQVEVGLKFQLFGDRFEGTVSAYELKRRNIATDDPDSEEFVFVTTGEQRSRGFELDGIWRITPNWELVASYGNTDAEVTEDNELVVGSDMVNIPRDAFSVWTKYVVPGGALEGLGFSAGLRHVSEQAGDMTYAGAEEFAFELPSFTVYDAAISWQRGRYRAALSVSNLTDEVYFPASFSRTFVMPGEPRSYRFSVGVSL